MDSIKKKTIPKPTYFGTNLKLLRKMSGLSQTALGKNLDMSRSKIASYESGMVEPNAKVFIKTCIYFNISPHEMLEIKLSNQPVSNTVNISDNLKTIDQYLIDQFEQFVAQTNNSTKITEGYKELRQLRQPIDTDSSKELNYILDDILSLSDTLVELNWELIRSILPTENIESK